MYDIFNSGNQLALLTAPYGYPPRRTACPAPPHACRDNQDPRIKVLEPLWTGLVVPRIPPPGDVKHALATEAPQMTQFATWLEGELAVSRLSNKPVCTVRPILLHGRPGVGKTYFAKAIARALGLPSHLMSLASSSDSRTLMGTSAGYATGAACLPVRIMATTGCIAPTIILDEIDKGAVKSSNGAWVDGLLPFLEAVSARGLMDEFLLTEVDVSHVVWIATANRIDLIPPALLSRFSCFEMTRPANGCPSDLFAPAIRSLAQDLDVPAATLADLLGPVIEDGISLPTDPTIRAVKASLRVALGALLQAATQH